MALRDIISLVASWRQTAR